MIAACGYNALYIAVHVRKLTYEQVYKQYITDKYNIMGTGLTFLRLHRVEKHLDIQGVTIFFEPQLL